MPEGRGSAVHGVMPPHYLHELPAEDEKRFEKIFQKLDHDGNGRIDVKDLSKALRKVGVDKYYAEVRVQSPVNSYFVLALHSMIELCVMQKVHATFEYRVEKLTFTYIRGIVFLKLSQR